MLNTKIASLTLAGIMTIGVTGASALSTEKTKPTVDEMPQKSIVRTTEQSTDSFEKGKKATEDLKNARTSMSDKKSELEVTKAEKQAEFEANKAEKQAEFEANKTEKQAEFKANKTEKQAELEEKGDRLENKTTFQQNRKSK